MVGDRDWTEEFLEGNNKRVRDRYERLVGDCERNGIKYLPASAGLYVWIDLRHLLGEGGEEALYSRLIAEFGMVMTPGRSQGMVVDGFFRCVFTAAENEDFERVLERMETLTAGE